MTPPRFLLAIFPGYYTGRATHVHTKIHTQWSPLENGTFTTGRIVHTGQFFVPDELNAVVDKIHPYTENPIKNKWGRTRNWADSLQIYQDSHKNGYGPTFDVHKLGGVIQQGLIGYITVGVDMDADYVSVTAVVWSCCRRDTTLTFARTITGPRQCQPGAWNQALCRSGRAMIERGRSVLSGIGKQGF
jgi:hypothetical protein